MSIPLEVDPHLSSLLPVLALAAGLLLLQVLLSRLKNRWPGLVLPALALVRSTVAAMGALSPALTMAMGGVLAVSPAPPPLPEALRGALVLFLVQNIPTAICLVLYALCRAARERRRRELERMDRQD